MAEPCIALAPECSPDQVKELLRELTAREKPLLWLMCSRRAFKEEISHLKAEVAFLKSELKLIPAMKTSIEALHRDVVDFQSKSNIGAKQSSYSEAVRRSGPRPGRARVSRRTHRAQQPFRPLQYDSLFPLSSGSLGHAGGRFIIHYSLSLYVLERQQHWRPMPKLLLDNEIRAGILIHYNE